MKSATKENTMNTFRHQMPYILIICLVSLSAQAQQKSDSLKTYQLNPVVVTATNVETLRSSVSNSITVISKQDIEQSGETSLLPIINKLVPGVFITERGILGYGVSTGAAGGISIRGTGGSPNTGVLVLTDGRPQLMGLMGHPLPDTYVSSGVDHVEVIRGPASLMHGTNAMGGVINIISQKNVPGGLSLNLGGAAGSFNTKKIDGNIGYGIEDGGILVSGSNYSTDGHRAYSDFKITNGSVKISKLLNEHMVLKADASVSKFKTYDPGTDAAPFIDHWVDITRGSSGFAIENNYNDFQGAVKAFYNFGEHTIYDGFHSTDNNLGLLAYEGTSFFEGNYTVAGFDYMHFGGNAENTISRYKFGEHFIGESGWYASVRQKLSNTIQVSAGIRFNNNNIYGYETIPQFGLTVNVTENSTIRASAGKGFRSPTIRELYLFPAPTPTLQPERMWNYEVGFLHNFNRETGIDIAAFISNGQNIIRMSGQYPNFILSNSGSFNHRGFEFSGFTTILEKLKVDASYSYLDAGDETMESPKHKVYIGGSYPVSILRISAGIQSVAGLYGSDNHVNPLPDYTLVNARVSAQLTNQWSVYVSGENLLDKKYQIMAGYPMPGITAIGGIHWSLL